MPSNSVPFHLRYHSTVRTWPSGLSDGKTISTTSRSVRSTSASCDVASACSNSGAACVAPTSVPWMLIPIATMTGWRAASARAASGARVRGSASLRALARISSSRAMFSGADTIAAIRRRPPVVGPTSATRMRSEAAARVST